ncbi:hypothetical protein BVX98_07810 [bacterium F11]|nr:hypothetical protein BVX98_07810 [bacterium F11]
MNTAILESILIPSTPSASIHQGLMFQELLNNKLRWDTKRVALYLDKNLTPFVSTPFSSLTDFNAFLKTTHTLKTNKIFHPTLLNKFPPAKTVICPFLGEDLRSFLLENPDQLIPSLNALKNYFRTLNCIKKRKDKLRVPPIVTEMNAKLETFNSEFQYLSKVVQTLQSLKDSNIQFDYGGGIEDPHMGNLRIYHEGGVMQAFTTDFDCFSTSINEDWSFGYFYATTRWLRHHSDHLKRKIDYFMEYFIESDLKRKFMFLLGAFSSFCGYSDGLKKYLQEGDISHFKSEFVAFNLLAKDVIHAAINLS